MAGKKKLTDKQKKRFAYFFVPSICIMLALIISIVTVYSKPDDIAVVKDQTSENVAVVVPDPSPLVRPDSSVVTDSGSPAVVSQTPVKPDQTDSTNRTGNIVPAVKGYLCIVLDDTGYSTTQVQAFLDLKIPLTFAIIPRLKFSSASADLISANGFQYIIHQPMQALNGQDPGEGALLTGMEKDKMVQILDENRKLLPKAIGINNHMGSALTADKKQMLDVLEWTRINGLFFLDSYTSAQSQAEAASKELNFSILKRDIFIDNDKDYESLKNMLRKSIDLSLKTGKALAIGHVTSTELPRALADMKNEFKSRGIELLSIGEFRKKT